MIYMGLQRLEVGESKHRGMLKSDDRKQNCALFWHRKNKKARRGVVLKDK
jgi:hypothetical protein